MKRIYSIIALCFTTFIVLAQDINLVITRDTLNIDIEGSLKQTLMADGEYYAFFGKEAPYGGSGRVMYILS